jgi:hypothetical protein
MLKLKRAAVLSIFILGGLVLSIQPANAWTQVTLAWSPNSEPDLAGYRVFSRLEGEDYDYDFPVWEGTETTCTIDILDENLPNYLVVRAFDTEGYESADSNEVCYNCSPSKIHSLNQRDFIDENGHPSSSGCFIDSLLD